MSAVIATKRAKCPACDTGFTFKTSRPRRFCGTQCQKAANNARRVPTGRPAGRPPRNPESPALISILRNSEVAPASFPDAPLQAPADKRIGSRVRIWLDSAALGSGERYLIVTEITPKRVKLYSAAALTEVTIPRDEFERHASALSALESYCSDPATVLSILERNLAQFERLKLDHDKPSEVAIERIRVATSVARGM